MESAQARSMAACLLAASDMGAGVVTGTMVLLQAVQRETIRAGTAQERAEITTRPSR
jgi:hypothetical protein